MMKLLKKIPREKHWDYFILAARFLIGWTFLRYGYSKMVDGQFGISDAELATPLKDLDLFRVSWYMFDQQPFKALIGISQLICGALLIINRTALLGAFLFLPIVTTILLIDLTFMPPAMANAFTWRLSFYILLDFLILWHYKSKMEVIWNEVWQNVNPKFKYPIWLYLLLPIVAIAIEVASVIPKALFYIILNPENVWSGVQGILNNIMS
ncbi:DoxX family membrane protein [Pontibacter sp. JH31]|uniref:DoxX family membrane protein n=1 Tax=Pontibacter aquaedesilientis TaxID=2766980 RepID=A0ABR7XL54_9BACT|nr:DoxX family membrane protein [Pontibacter aquaedesilientis]MBD1399034.1 DoxX family membrane protein [Pontibacter aquaedesilientis]